MLCWRCVVVSAERMTARDRQSSGSELSPVCSGQLRLVRGSHAPLGRWTVPCLHRQRALPSSLTHQVLSPWVQGLGSHGSFESSGKVVTMQPVPSTAASGRKRKRERVGSHG